MSAAAGKHSALRIHLALTTAAILFSLNYIISKVAMRAFTPFVFAYLRIAGSALVLLLIRERAVPPLPRIDRRRLIGYGILGVVINQTFFLAGLSLTTAHVAAILITTIPIFALAIAIALGRERATTTKIAGIGLAAAGAVLVIGFEGFGGTSRAAIGDLLIVLNSLSYAMYLVFSKPMMARLSARRVLLTMFVSAFIILLPIAIWPLMREPWARIDAASWLRLLIVILGPTVAAYLINAWGLAHAESSLVAAYTYLQPVFTILLAAMFLGESIRPTVIVCGAMILAGVYLAGSGKLKTE